jgi:hypothetical protein
MKEFSPDAVCEKCLGSCISTTWKPAHMLPHASTGALIETFPERLAKRCQCCGYSWSEKPAPKLDTPEEVS